MAQFLGCSELEITKFLPEVGGYGVPNGNSPTERLVSSIEWLERTYERFVEISDTLPRCMEPSPSRESSMISDKPSNTSSGAKIAIAVVAVLSDSGAVDVSLQNKIEYARKHSYDVIVINDLGRFGRKPAWAKIPLVFSMLSEYDYVWSLDLDTIILRDIPLDEIIVPGFDIIITADALGLNTGSFRSSAFDQVHGAE